MQELLKEEATKRLEQQGAPRFICVPSSSLLPMTLMSPLLARLLAFPSSLDSLLSLSLCALRAPRSGMGKGRAARPAELISGIALQK